MRMLHARRSGSALARRPLGQGDHHFVAGSQAQGPHSLAWSVNRFDFIPKPSKSIWFHCPGTAIVVISLSPTSKSPSLMPWQPLLRLLTRWPTYFAAFRKYPLRQFPFSIIYEEMSTEVIVFAVAHGHRHPGYWRNRPGI